MDEITQYPLRIEQKDDDSWFFVACDDIPGLTSFGPNLDDVLKGLEEAAADLLRRRGMNVLSVTVRPMTKPAEENRPIPTWGPIGDFALCPVPA